MAYLFFNPENDLALALGENHYNPPKNISLFAKDLDTLPMWYAEAEDIVLTRRPIDPDWLNNKEIALCRNQKLVTIADYWKKSAPADLLMPWGWNASLYKEWTGKGRSSQQVDCERVRQLSSREMVIGVLDSLQALLPKDFVVPQKLTTLEEVREFVVGRPRGVLKSPWSSSGKGLCWTEGEWNYALERWTDRLLQKQGFVMGEQVYDKLEDFAMEFRSCDGEISFVGYSLFRTENGKYKCNLLESDEMLESRLACHIPVDALMCVRRALMDYFRAFMAPHYTGCFGVDMMVCRSADDSFFIHPCVEINLRMNMGIVAHTLYERYVASSSVGEYYVQSFPSNEQLLSFCQEQRISQPLVIQDGKVESGFLPLTFYDNLSTTLAYIFVRKLC